MYTKPMLILFMMFTIGISCQNNKQVKKTNFEDSDNYGQVYYYSKNSYLCSQKR